jgi:hypothetical protein
VGKVSDINPNIGNTKTLPTLVPVEKGTGQTLHHLNNTPYQIHFACLPRQGDDWSRIMYAFTQISKCFFSLGLWGKHASFACFFNQVFEIEEGSEGGLLQPFCFTGLSPY